ncbi:ShlB/FhaC/HecB family hemolysin secretion/activation protein [bacterium]|nr:ShlB/FhaC/HecB family hemolysin secretion/activation protein [bacterium]
MLKRNLAMVLTYLLMGGLPTGAQPVWDEQDIVDSDAETEQTLKVDGFVLEGNTLISSDELGTVLDPYQGKELTLPQMKDVAREVTAYYHKKGFMLVKAIIPKQAFDSTRVRLKVVEGRLGNVVVEGAEHYDPDWIRERFLASYQDGALRRDDFVQGLILLNEFSDLKVKATLKPGQELGSVDALLKVEDALPVHFGVDYNNYGTQQTGINRAGLTFDAGNVVNQGDQFNLRGVIGFPASGTNFFQAVYSTPVGLDGTQLSGTYQNGAFTVSQGLGAILDIRGRANVYTLAVAHPLDRSFEHSSNLGASLSYKDVSNDFFGGALPFTRDQYATARLTYQEDWRGVSGRTLLQTSWTQGLGGTGSGDPLVSRNGASGGFGKLNLELGRVQNLQPGLYGILRGSAQLATQPLYVAEQFALGGPDTVRGFAQAELLGDEGYLVSAELRWSPIEEEPDRFQLAFFVDHGGVSLKRAGPGDLPRGAKLTGAGLGFRLGLGAASHARLDIGFPISPTNNTLGSNPAIYGGVQTRF